MEIRFTRIELSVASLMMESKSSLVAFLSIKVIMY